MQNLCILLFVVLLAGQIKGQNLVGETDTDPKSKKGLFVEDFAYPVFLDEEMHSSFTVGYEFDAKFLVELQGFYDTYRLSDVFGMNFRSRYYFSSKFYLFSGIGLEIERDKYGLRPPPPRIKTTNGFGYDVDNKFSLEAKHDLHFNKTNFGNYGTPNLFSISGKYKF